MAIEDNASIALIPSGYKSGKLYSVIPDDGDGDFTHSRGSTATRVAASGLIETVASGVPRLDYPLIDGVVQDCPALLLEPSRTNLITYSEDFSQSSWQKLGSSVTSNSINSPNGQQNSSEIIGDGSQAYIQVSDNIVFSSTGNYTFSVFAKKGNNNFLRLQFAGVTGGLSAYFDLSNGSTSSSGASMEDFGNGWYRCILTNNLTGADLNGSVKIFTSYSTSTSTFPSSSDANGQYMYIYGSQVEAGSYPTSYIKTSGSTVTRSADVCNGSGTSAEFNDSEGVLFAEIAALADDLTFRQLGIAGSLGNEVNISFDSVSNRIGGIVRSATNYYTTSFVVSDTTLNSKIAVKYKSGDGALWINGFEVDTNTSTVPPVNLTNLKFAVGTAYSNPFYGKTKQLMTFKTALTDSELETLTSWDSFNAMAKGQLYTIE